MLTPSLTPPGRHAPPHRPTHDGDPLDPPAAHADQRHRLYKLGPRTSPNHRRRHIEIRRLPYPCTPLPPPSHLPLTRHVIKSLLHTLNAHTSSCLSVAQCPRGRHIAIGGADALVTLWDTAHLVCRHGLADAQGPVRGVSFSFDGSYVIGACDEGNGVQVVSSIHLSIFQADPPWRCDLWGKPRKERRVAGLIGCEYTGAC